MSTPTVYKHTDASAPGLPPIMNNYADVFAIFHGCLVAGYGSKSGAGWTLEWQDEPNNKFVLKSASGYYLRFERNGYYTSWGAWTIQSYRTMTDIDTGTGAGPVNQFVFAQNQYGGCGAWTIVADDQRFYLYVDNAASTNTRTKYLWFIGPLNTTGNLQNYDGIVNGFHGNTNIKNNYNMGIFGHEASYKLLNMVQVDKDPAGSQGLYSLYPGAIFNFVVQKMRPENTTVVHFSPYQLMSENAVIGSLPGLLIPATEITGTTGDVISVNGKDCLLIRDFQATDSNGYTTVGCVLLNTEAWDD